ncbi:hypothetical protein AHiyo6_10070, partial [Arthrobacter sp. Hiyo6]
GVRWVTVATAAVLPAALLVAAPSYIGQRTEFGRDPQDDFRFSARAVEQLAKPGDAFVLSAAGDLVYQAYPESFKGWPIPRWGSPPPSGNVSSISGLMWPPQGRRYLSIPL